MTQSRIVNRMALLIGIALFEIAYWIESRSLSEHAKSNTGETK